MKTLAGKPFRSILVVKLSAIGDVIMATSIPRGLRDLYPDARIDWLVEPLSADVLAGNPFLNEVIVWERAKGRVARGARGARRFAGDLMALRRRLRGRYELALDMQGLGRSALAAWASGAPVRVGKVDAREGGRLLLTHRFHVPDPTYKAARQYTEILKHLGHPDPPDRLEVYPDDANRRNADVLLEGFETPNGFVSVTPATTRPYKHWTDDAFAATLDLLHERFGLDAVIHGGPGDVQMAESIAGMCERASVRVIAGRTTLRDAAEVIRRSRLLVGVDTGLMHFGMATGTPTVAVFGPTNCQRLRDEENVIALQMGGTRHRDNVQRRRQWWNDRSIEANRPEDVLEAAETLLGSGATEVAGR